MFEQFFHGRQINRLHQMVIEPNFRRLAAIFGLAPARKHNQKHVAKCRLLADLPRTS